MPLQLQINDLFPDLVLPDQQGMPVQLSQVTRPSLLDERLRFSDGYPVIVVFYRGFFCPRDQQQMRQLVHFQDELAVNYGRIVTIGVDPPLVQAAFRAGLGATWPFLADEDRATLRQLDIVDETEGEYAYCAQPFTFVLRPDLRIHRIYNGWFFVGRPTLEELRQDLRAIMQMRTDYRYEAYDTPAVSAIRIPQQTWSAGVPELGASGLPVATGVVEWFSTESGIGFIVEEGSTTKVFFHFTAIPGHGYRTIRAGTHVQFERIASATGFSARNIRITS